MKMHAEWSMEEKLVELASQMRRNHNISIEDVSLPPSEWGTLEKSLGSLIQHIELNGRLGIRLHGNFNMIRVWKHE